jgi:hypothetical protein
VALTNTERSRRRRQRLRADQRAAWERLNPWIADLTPLEALLDDGEQVKAPAVTSKQRVEPSWVLADAQSPGGIV